MLVFTKLNKVENDVFMIKYELCYWNPIIKFIIVVLNFLIKYASTTFIQFKLVLNF